MGWLVAFLVIAAACSYWFVGAVAVAAFFAIGSLPFWLMVAAVVCIAWYEIADDEGGLAVIPFAVFALFVQFVVKFNLVEWVKSSWHVLAADVGWYLLGALVYSLFRWLLHLRKKVHELDALEASFRKGNSFDGPLETANEDIKLRFNRVVQGSYNPDIQKGIDYYPEIEGVVPLFARNKFTIFRWFWWWPLSLLGWLLNDLVREVWDVIKRGLQGLMDWMSGLVFGRRSQYVLTKAQREAFEERQERSARRPSGGVTIS